MSQIKHTRAARVAQNEANAAIATVVTFTGTTIVFTGGITSASAANAAGNGMTFAAGAVSGGNVTFTGSGTPLPGDSGSFTVNGEKVLWAVPIQATGRTLAQEIAGIASKLKGYLVNGDLLAFLASDKAVTVVTNASAGQAATYGIPVGSNYNINKDTRPTITDAASGSFPSSFQQIVVDDTETTGTGSF